MKLSIKDVLAFAWGQYKTQPLIWLKILVVGLLISGVSSWIAQSAIESTMPLLFSMPLNIADFFLQMLIGMTMMYFALQLHDGKEVRLKDALKPVNLLWRYIGGSIVFAIGVLLGLILLIVPGIIFAIAASMWPYLLLDKRMSPWASIKESLRITRGHRLRLFGLGVILTLLNIIGLIPIGLGLLITVPISTLATVHAYRILESAVDESSVSAGASVSAV